jgi:RNA polymerase sigma-70 factor, ECF subfamily
MRPLASFVSRTAQTSAAHLEPATSAVDVAVLYRVHERTVMRWAARLGGPGIDVEDVVQEVFLIAKRRLRSFDGPGSVRTWLFRTTEKIVQAARRKHRLRRWLSRSAEPAASGMSAPRPTPAEAVERQQEIGGVYQVLDRLPQRQRQVLVLFELEGLSTQEIAELVGARIGTVRVWLFRARARFLEEHQRLFESDPTAAHAREGREGREGKDP